MTSQDTTNPVEDTRLPLLPRPLAARVVGFEREAERLAALSAGVTVTMLMLKSGLRMEIPASIAAEAMRITLAGVATLPPADAAAQLGLVPVFSMVPIPGDPHGGFSLEPALGELVPRPFA